MNLDRAVTYDDLRIEDITGAVFFDELADLPSRHDKLLKAMRKLADDLRTQTG